MYNFEVIETSNIDIEEFYSPCNKTIFTSLEWINFIIEDQKAIPVIIKICKGNVFMGYFCGAAVNKYGVRIIGSPFRGWSTCFMGLDLVEEFQEERAWIYEELSSFLFKNYKCHYIEITDRNLTFMDVGKISCSTKRAQTLELDVSIAEEEIFRAFKVDCRNFIRQFERRGARLEIAQPNEQFADEFYNQLIDVFAKQGLVPTYGREKVHVLIRNLADCGNVLCLKVLDPNNKCIATSIFPGMNHKFFFWGGASYREYQMYRPNEYMIWYAIKYWKNKGCTVFDMVGIREYKRKFRPVEIEYPRVIMAKYQALIGLRDLAEKGYYQLIKIKGKFVKKPQKPCHYDERVEGIHENSNTRSDGL